ncbi:DNAhel 2 [Tomelloso virus]|uniref:DNAhel 2 n=1 Tax=Tomelloso virus TaxID=2053981 RepID=A0A2H4T2T4_9VIRU|nr:DNAhel 2 [Tomelloso virus]ATY70179.1 DNAhel 2 [Tomelloso virus]
MTNVLELILNNIPSTAADAPPTNTNNAEMMEEQKIKFTSNSIELPDHVPVTLADLRNESKNSISDGIERAKTGILMDRVVLPVPGSRNENASFDLALGEMYDKVRHDNEMVMYRECNLNSEQREIFDCIKEDPTRIILLQAGPGCGKSYTLKTIAYGIKNVKFDTIIYKLDLLDSFKYNTRRFTVAKFVMRLLQIGYFQYQALDRLLSQTISFYDFMLVITAMIKKSKLPNMLGGVVFLDEYTVVSKPILLVTLMLLEYHKIGAIICGDRNQLQNIFNSRHAPLSSYKIASSFADKSFVLHKNERCSDKDYNDIIGYISQFSCNRRLDDFAFAMVSAIFLPQLIAPPNYYQVHLAGTHQELSTLAHTLVCNNRIPTEFYAIDRSKVRNPETVSSTLLPTEALLEYQRRIDRNEPPRVDKFLPYLPLMKGGRYFVNKHSEHSQGILKEINPDGSLLMEMDDGNKILVTRNTKDGVMFEEHRKYLLNNESGRLYSYPIYPAEFMSIHMCQGCTIVENLDLILTNTQYQGLYVAMSRVTRPEQISRVTIPNQLSFIVSTIIHFPKLVETMKITVNDLELGMTNYVFYDVSHNASPFLPLIHDFILNTDPNVRRRLRNAIIEHASTYPQRIIQHDFKPPDAPSELLTMSTIIKYREIFMALACVDEIDRNVWLHEYILCTPEFGALLPNDFRANSITNYNRKFFDDNELTRLGGLNDAYPMEMSTIEYIEFKSKAAIRMQEHDRLKNEKYIIKQNGPYDFLESTEFCAKIYKRIKEATEKINSEWLIDELNIMLKDFKLLVTAEPPKVNSKHTFTLKRPQPMPLITPADRRRMMEESKKAKLDETIKIEKPNGLKLES